MRFGIGFGYILANFAPLAAQTVQKVALGSILENVAPLAAQTVKWFLSVPSLASV